MLLWKLYKSQRDVLLIEKYTPQITKLRRSDLLFDPLNIKFLICFILFIGQQ